MGLFSKLKEMKDSAAREISGLHSAGALGFVPVPGSTQLWLPAGRVRVTYSQEPVSVGNADSWFWKRPQIDLRVQGADGQDLGFQRPSGSTVAEVPGGARRSAFGTIDVAVPGDYQILAQPQDEWYRRPGLGPALLFDPAE